jgi:hypothetical protein
VCDDAPSVFEFRLQAAMIRASLLNKLLSVRKARRTIREITQIS